MPSFSEVVQVINEMSEYVDSIYFLNLNCLMPEEWVLRLVQALAVAQRQ